MSNLEFPAIMHADDTTIPVIVPASDYADALRVADQVTGPGQLWDGFDVIVLDRPDGDNDTACRFCGEAAHLGLCH